MTTPSLVGTTINAANASSYTLALPAGTIAGDYGLIFMGHAYGPIQPTGWTTIDQQNGANWNGAVYGKTLDATDITNGSVVVISGGGYSGVATLAVVRGGDVEIAFVSQRRGDGTTPITLSTNTAPFAGNLALLFASARTSASATISLGTQLATQTDGSNAVGTLNEFDVTASGALTSDFTYGAAPTGSYQSIISLSNALPPSVTVSDQTAMVVLLNSPPPPPPPPLVVISDQSSMVASVAAGMVITDAASMVALIAPPPPPPPALQISDQSSMVALLVKPATDVSDQSAMVAMTQPGLIVSSTAALIPATQPGAIITDAAAMVVLMKSPPKPNPPVPPPIFSGISSVTKLINAYPYVQYQNDDNISAFFEAFNIYAQAYLDWFNDLNLPIYTQSPVSGPLLDWVGKSLYGISRPSLPTGIGRPAIGPPNTFTPNMIPVNGYRKGVASSFTATTDDTYRRCITWAFYKGDGQTFNPRWLKRRINRFLAGLNGNNVPNDTTYDVSLQPIGLKRWAITLANTTEAFIFKTAVDAGVLELPLQITWTVILV